MATDHSVNRTWKYLSFALIGLLAAGSTVSFIPQASAHITTNVQHMLEHIYAFVDGIEAKTNNLPADPASNTVVNTRASQTSVNNLQTTANGIGTKVTNIETIVGGLGSGSGGENVNTAALLIAIHCDEFQTSPAYAPSCDLQSAHLPNANLPGALFNAADLFSANLSGADLSGADLDNANLIGANLSGADLSGAKLGAKLEAANLSGAIITGATFDGCIGTPTGTPANGEALPTCS